MVSVETFECMIAEAMGESFFIKGIGVYSFRVTLIPFGWEYWNTEVVSFAGSLYSVIYRTYPDDNSAEKVFMDWLDAQMSAWEGYWASQGEGSGPLKRLPDGLKGQA